MKIMFNLVFCAPTPSTGEASFELAESGRGSLDQRSGFGVAGTGFGAGTALGVGADQDFGWEPGFGVQGLVFRI